MPLYTDPGYSYYGGSGSYSSYYGAPSYGSSSSSSSAYAPYSSTYNRAYSGTYVLPTPSRSTQYTSLVSRYQPKLSTITESPLTARGSFIPLTRIQSPTVSTYNPTLSSTYISTRTSRPRTINTADIDVSASSRLGRHHHMEERKTEDEKEESTEEVQSNNTDSDTNSSVVDPNSPYMPRIDGTDVGHHARSTIKRDRTVVRLSIMRPRSRGEPKVEVPTVKVDQEPDPIPQPELSTEKKDILERLYIQNESKEEGLKISVTDMAESQIGESSLNEVIIEVDPVTNTVRRLSIPQVPTFHDICEDISSDKIDDDLNAGVLRRRASLIQEQEIEILNELQKSQSGSIQVIHLERNVHQEGPRKSRKSKKTKKVRHKITANVEVENSPLTPVIKHLIDEDSTSSVNIATPKFTFNIEDIEEHKVFKLPKKRVKSVKSKKSEESSVEINLDKVPEKELKSVILNKPEEATVDVNLRKPNEMVEKEFVKSDESQQQPVEETQKSIKRIQKSDSGEDFWSQIGTRESLYMNHRKKFIEKTQTSTEAEIEAPPPTPTTPLTPSIADVLDKQSTVLSKTQSLAEISKKEDSLPPTSPKKPSAQPLKKDNQTKIPPKKIATKSQDSPKSKNLPKVLAKKKSSPKIDAKEEAALLESNLNSNSNTHSKPKTKPSASSATPSITTNDENITFLKINSGSGAKSPEKNKTAKSDTDANKTTVLKTAPVEVVQKAADNKCDQIPEIFTKAAAIAQLSNEETPSKHGLQKPLAITETSVDAVGTIKTVTTGSDKLQLCDRKKATYSILPIKIDDGTPSLFEVSSPMASPTSPKSPTTTTPATLTMTQSIESVTSPPATDASAAQVSKQITTTTTATTTKNSETSTAATVSSSPSTSDRGVLGSGSNNLSKFATVSNLAQYLLDVDAELADYIPSSAEESDSSSGSYSGDGSLSASMKKKNKQLKKKAKEEHQAFDPNKKIKIDTKKKCYVKEEAPRYPLIATPRPLCKREKITYEESSNSSSEETDSESECTTSDEYEDELSPKDAIIRMSTCSNDSGFDGGTAPSSSKRALETSYTYSQFQKSGRITAPATSIPRFKKYSVEDFHFLAVLGKGSFGKVLLAELRNTDFYYAVKCLKKDVVLEDDDVECTLIERKVLALGTKHPYLCHLFCTFQTESHLFFVMEYLNGGDLMFHIQESGRFPEDRARFYGAEIISGLKFLHKKGIIYRDLKLDNVLLDFDGHVRIADFGMCKLQIYLDKTADSFCGTPDYMAPEIIKGDKYNQNVDWWSFGVLLYEMLIGQSPFSGCDEDELFWSICNEIPWFPVYITKEATSILKGLLEKDYTKRVGSQYSPAGDICDHIFFKDIDWSLLEKRQLAPPFKPQVKHPLDTQYFDRAFTRERVRLTPIDKEILQSMDQEQFQGFSYTNPNATLD